MSQAFYRKWRPRHWEQVVGQEHVLQTLTNAVRAGRVGHAYLFAGPRGTGKTTVARILAKAVNCTHADASLRPCDECEPCRAVNENRFLDLIEIDAASNTSVEDVRDLRDKINFSPSQGRYKIYIVDEVHMLSTAAFNALLKTLEEPPPHAIFVLATTEVHKIPATVLSRCQRHEFRRLPVGEIAAHLEHIASQEGLEARPEALTAIARQATGSMRDAISLLDQLASTGEVIDLELTQNVLGTTASGGVLALVDCLRDRRSSSALETLEGALDAGADPRALARQMVEYLRGLLLVQLGNPEGVEAPGEVREHMADHAAAFSTPEVLRMLRAFNAAAAETRGGWQPSLGLELALAEALVDRAPGDGEPPAMLYQLGEDDRALREGPGERKGALQDRGHGREKKQSIKAEQEKKQRTGEEQPGKQHTKAEPEKKQASKAETEPEAKQKAKPGPEKSAREEPRSKPEAAQAISLGAVVKAWAEVRRALKAEHPGIGALLNSCKPLEVHGDTLLLGFQSETVRALLDVPEKLAVAQQAIAGVLGVELRLHPVVTNARGQLPPDVNPDGMVATAIRNGGEIVDSQE